MIEFQLLNGDVTDGLLKRPCPKVRVYGQEAFFKCMKSRFGLDQFGQRTLIGVIRFFALCFLAYILTAISRVNLKVIPDWQELAAQVRRELLPLVCWMEIERERELLIPILQHEMDNYASIT